MKSTTLKLKPRIVPGTALVIAGPQGCGKTALAQELARKRGAYIQIQPEDLDSPFQSWLGEKIKTVIVEGKPTSRARRNALKQLVSSKSIVVQQKNQKPMAMETPTIIFCTNDNKWVESLADNRRFTVYTVATP